MALISGDYNAVEQKAVETLLADTEPGGLRDPADPAIAYAAAGDIELAQTLPASSFPALLVRAVRKEERPAAASHFVIKSFILQVTALARSPDREAAQDLVRRIASRVELVLREQTAASGQFLGLADLVEGSEGMLVCAITRTSLPPAQAEPGQVLAKAVVEAELQVPCAYRWD